MREKLFSVEPTDRTICNVHKVENQEILSELKKTLYSEGGQVLAQIVQRSCGVSICGDRGFLFLFF